MATKNHEYKIDLNMSERSKAVLKDFQSAGDNINELNEKLNNYAQHGIKAGNEYCKTLQSQADELQKQINLQEKLQAEIVADKRLTEQQKKEALKRNREETKALKNKQKELQTRIKVYQVTQKVYKEDSLGLKLMFNKIKAQEKLNQLLGKESKLRQKMTTGGKHVAKGAAAGVGLVGALVGTAVSDVGSIIEKERALRTLKVDPSLAEAVFGQTGADYTQIVDTLNKLSGKFSDKGDLIAATIADIRFPGAADMYVANTGMGAVTAQNMQSVLEQIQKSSGAQELTEAIQASLKAASVTKKKITRDNYIQAYAALRGIGVEEEQINRTIGHVARQKGDFVENFNKYMQKGAGLHGQSAISAQAVSLDKLDYSVKDRPKTAAEELQERIAKMQEIREKISMKILPIIANVLEDLEKEGFFDRLGDLIKCFTQFLEDIAKNGFKETLIDAIKTAWDSIRQSSTLELSQTAGSFIDTFSDKIMPLSSFGPLGGIGKALSNIGKALSDMGSTGNAQGGLVTSPSLVGEMGPELVLPLNNPGRCQNIVNNYTNTNNFALQGPQTALSLSQSISNNRFIKTASTF